MAEVSWSARPSCQTISTAREIYVRRKTTLERQMVSDSSREKRHIVRRPAVIDRVAYTTTMLDGGIYYMYFAMYGVGPRCANIHTKFTCLIEPDKHCSRVPTSSVGEWEANDREDCALRLLSYAGRNKANSDRDAIVMSSCPRPTPVNKQVFTTVVYSAVRKTNERLTRDGF